MIRTALFLTLSLLGLDACSSKSCTEVGCIDGASFSLTTADGTWLAGQYVLTIGSGEVAHVCSMKLPEAAPAEGRGQTLQCEPPVGYSGVTLFQDSICEERRNGDSVSQVCTPLADHFTLRATIPGTPGTLRISLTRDGSLLVDQSVPLAYKETRPNGPDCEPLCRQASAQLKLP